MTKEKDKKDNRLITILFLIALIISMPIIFVMCGGLDKIADFTENRKNDVNTDISELMSNAADNVSELVDEAIGSEAEVEVTDNVRIEDIIGISQLQTLKYDYDAIYRATDTNGNPIYYVSYDGSVELGINFEDVSITYGSEADKTITVTIPQVQIFDMYVNAATMDYIFEDNSYDNAQTPIDAQAACEADLAQKIQNDENMYEYARVNTEAEIRALTEPLVNQFYPDYRLVIEWEA